MPNFDKTGPNKEGPRTGRGLGNCIDENLCINGPRRRCCEGADRNFYQNRMNRMGRMNRTNNPKPNNQN